MSGFSFEDFYTELRSNHMPLILAEVPENVDFTKKILAPLLMPSMDAVNLGITDMKLR